MVRSKRSSSPRRSEKLVYFALFVVLSVITFALFLFNSNNSNNSKTNENQMINFIQNIDLKGDVKVQLVGAYIYNPGMSLENQNSRFIKVETLPRKHRIIKPGYMVTMDYDPERLNVYINDDNYIRDAKFG